MQLLDDSGDDHHYLRIRASGTEPINRIYIESSKRELGQAMMAEALHRLELITIDCLRRAHSPWHLVDMLSETALTPEILKEVQSILRERGWEREEILQKIQALSLTLEKRNRKTIMQWYQALS